MADKKSWRDYSKYSSTEKTSEASTSGTKTGSWRDYSSLLNGSASGGKTSGSWRDYSTVDTRSIVAGNVTNRLNKWLQNHNSYISDYQKRYEGRKGGYEDAYVSDSAEWLNNARQQKSTYDAEADAILAYLDQHKDYLDTDWAEKIKNTIKSAKGTQGQILNAARNDSEFWAKFNPNEEQTAAGYTADKVYSEWQAQQKQTAADMAFDVDAGMLELEELKKERDTWLADQEEKRKQAEKDESFWDSLGRWLSTTPDTTIPLAGATDVISNQRPTNEYDKRITELEDQIERAKYLQGYEGFMANKNAEDYATNSQYVSTRTGVAMDDARWGFGNTMYDESKLFGDFLYDYINKNEDALAVATVNNTATDAYFLGFDKGFLQTLTDDEIGVYNSLYKLDKEQGTEKATEFLRFIESDLKGRKRAQEQAFWAGYAKESPVGSSVFSTLISPMKGLSYLGQAADMLDDGKMDENAGYNRFSDIPSTIRSTVSTTIENSGKWGKVGSFAYNTGMSMADFLFTTAVSGGNQGLSLAIMGTGAAADATIAAKKRGLDDAEAFSLGTIAGIAEVAMEKISLGAWLEGDMTEGALRYVLKNALSEGGEEAGTSLVNLLADVMISGDKSEWNVAMQAYIDQGKSPQEAFGLVAAEQAAQIGLDALGGMLSGAAIGGGTYVGTSIASGFKYGDSAKDKGYTQKLVTEGLELNPDSQYIQKAKTKLDNGKNLTGMQVRNILAANQEKITANDMQKIQKAAEQRLTSLGETKDVGKLAEIATKWATGQDLNPIEKRTLTHSEYGSRVANELLPKNIQSGDYSTAWAENIGTKQVNKEAYNKELFDKWRSAMDEIAKMDDPATYKALEERVGDEEKFTVSKNGKATVRKSGEEISLDKVEVAEFITDKETGKIKDMVLKADGQTVKASEIDYADDSQSYLFAAVPKIENITPADAQVIIRDYDPASGLSVSEYLNGVDEAFTYGYHGYSEADLKAGDFTTKLTDTQAMSAYVLGQNAKNSKKTNKAEAIKRMRTAVEAEVQKAKAEGKEAPKAKAMSITFNDKGNIVDFDKSLRDKLNPDQKAAPVLAEVFHEMGLGTNFEMYESYVNTKGERVYINENGVEEAAPAGIYRKSDGTVCIDLNAYNGKELTLYSMSHELTHFIQQWSDEKYQVLADFLVQTYEKTDLSMHKRVLKEQARLEGIRKKAVSYDEAFDEVVANAMMKMLSDSSVMDKLAELQMKDAKLAKKLWYRLKKLLKEFFKTYEKYPALFHDTFDLMEMKEEFEQMKQMWAEAFVEASENFQANLMAQEVGVEPVAVEDITQYSYSSLAEAAGFEAVENEDGTRSFVREGKKVSKVTVEDIENSPIGAFINFSLEMKDISAADAKKQKQMFADICTMACKTNDFAMTMQFVGSAVFTGMKANADKQYGTTYDFPSICTKTQAVIDAMSAKMVSLGRGLNTNEIVQLYEDVFASGNPVPCPECYVFSRWIGIGGLLDNIKKYQDYYGDMDVKDVAKAYLKMKAEVSKFADEQGISFGKAKGALTSKLTKEFNKLNEKIEKAENQGEKVKPSDRQRLAELEPMMNTVKSMTWLENVYFADSSLKKVNPNFRVPDSVLFDLNNGEAFATKYKEAWAFRTTQGAGYGKAITPYAEARLGEGVLVTNNTTNAIKGKAQGSLDNYFLQQMGKLDKKSRDALKRARMKQKIQAFIGGQRFQSTSDARYENASDYLLAALEMQAMGGMVQVYTKVDGAVPAFSAWGFSINQSLMPLNGGLDADGNVKDTAVGGMKPSVAFENRSKHESAGTITIGVNDNHIRAMFKQLVRDFIIPYHASGGKADTVAEFRRIQEGKEAKGKAVRSTDYSRTQSDKVLSDEVLRWQGKTDAQIQRIHEIRNARIAILTGGKVNMTVVRSNRFLSALYDKLNGGEWDGVKLAKSKVESQIFPNEFWDQTVTYEESAKVTKDYLEYCEDLGFLHRFSGMVPSNGKLVPVNGYNENGERVQLTDLAYKYDANGNKTAEVEEFFWKVLTDRRMYDNNGKYLPQKVVTLNDTTTDTVTGFAKNNQGREYDKAKAEALAKKYAGELDADLDENANADYDSIGFNDIKDVIKKGVGIKWNNGNAIKLDIAEYAAVVSRISTQYDSMEHHGGFQYIERSTDGEDAKFFLYLFLDHGFDDYDIIARLDYAKQDALIDELRRMIQNGRETKRVSAGSGGLRTFYGNAAGSGNSNPNGGIQNANGKKNSGGGGQRSQDNGQPGATNSNGSHENGNSTSGVKKQFSSQETDADNAPTFYSKMGKVIEGVQQEKFGASSVISMLRGRGVKAEEIRWSGIQAFLDGKKSVTKQELLDFINSSMLQIEEEERGEYKKYSPEQQKRFGELEHEIDAAWDEIWELWEKEFGEGLPMDLVAAPYVEGRITRTINNANEEAGTEISEGSKRIIELARLVDLHRREIESISYQAETPETKWSQYKVDGGENYRELLFKLPNSTYSNTAMTGHWGENAKGILAHARMQDFEVDGKKMLFIEEIQSDWHNAGSKHGYSTPEAQKLIDEFSEIRSKRLPYHDKVRPVVNDASEKLGLDEDDVYHDLLNKDWNTIHYFDELAKHFSDEDLANLKADADLFKQHKALREKMNASGTKPGAAPEAPFKDGKYTDFVLKRLLRMAAEEGYDSIGWTTAEMQDARWANTMPHKEGAGKSGFLKAYTIEYDQDMPKFLKKYGKQWDADVGKTLLNNHAHDIERVQENIASWQQDLYEADDDSERDFIQNQIDYQKDELEYYINRSEVWSMDITPAMKQSVLKEGQELYSSQETDFDSKGNQLTKEQRAFFAQSKVRDENGNLLVMYHGSQNLGFTVFDPNASDDNRSFFFSDNPGVAASYSNSENEVSPYAVAGKESGLYKTYLNLKNPYVVDARGSKWNNIVEFSAGDEFLSDIGAYMGIVRSMDSSLGISDFLDSLRGDLVGATEYAINELNIDEDTGESYFTEEEQKDLLELAERIDKAYTEWDEDAHLDEDGESTSFESYVMQNYTAKTTRKIASEAYKNGYDGVIFKNLVDVGKFGNILQQNYEKSTVAVAFDSSQIKSVDNKKPTSDPDMRFSTQDTDLDSHRQMLANAFEGITQNSKEYELIQEYKGRIKILNEYEEKLAKLNAEIRKMLFDPDTERDAKKLKELQDEAKKVRENINRNDKKLLSLEASKPLRDVIDRERKKESQKTKAHVKQLIKNKKERAEQTELRHKIRKTVRDLDKILNRGNKQRNVKEDMKGFVSTALDLADYLFTDHISNDDLIRRGIDAELIRGEKEAQLVKETEDILTKLYDEADSLTDEEFTRLDEKRKANEAKLKDLLTAQRNKRLSTPVYNLFNDLVTEYASLKNSKQDAVKAAYNEELENSLRAFISEDDRVKILKNMRVADMTTEELNWLYRAYTMVLNNVRNANKFHAKGMTESIEQVVGQIAGDFGSRKIPEKKLAIVAQKLANKIGWDYEKLYYALDRIGSDAFTKLIMNLADSENTVMQDIIEAAEFRDEIVKNYGFNNWDVNKKIDKEFMDNTGKKFTMTLGELMSLYAYSRREGAWDHIEYGGFVFGEKALTNPKPADSYKLSKDQCEAITSLLTKEQKGYVEDMQKFLSETMGEKGNEVSMMLYGIKMFGEKNYFPIHIAGQFKAQANESQAKAAAGFQSMSNAGFTHAQNPNAKAPFVLEGFNEVWADHVNEMSRYHGTVPALEDLRRVMNRSTYSDSVAESQSIKQLMENHYGEEAVKYFDNLYREANSGAITDKLQNKSKKLLSLFRKNSVAYSLSVIIQQPSALVRAYAMIDKKYFGFKGFGAITSGVAKAVSSKWNPAYANAYNEMLKYAPGVTMAKQIGGFDTATGGSIRSTLLDTGKSLKQKWKTGTALEKGKAILDVVDDNAIANLPNVADKIAWIEIWNACKRETVAKHKDLAPTSEEFMKIVGDRFTEVIRATQVYDSIFAKSPMLKSKNLGVQMLVSFMNEPNTVANMVEKSVRDMTKGDWNGGLRTGAAVIYSIIFNNVLKSVIYALRDDDEDETYIEKYIEAITGGMMDDLNALNYIPLVRDAWSIAQGYDVKRADMAIVSDAVGALNNVFKNAAKNTEDMTEEELIEFDKKVTETNWQLVESLAAFLGIPVKNIRREINGLIDHAKIASANAGMTNASTVWDSISEAVIDSIPFMSNKETKNDKLYDAIVSGDTAYVGRLKSTYKDDAAYNSAVRKALRENDSRIHDAAQARYDGNMDEYKRIFREIQGEGNFTFDEIMDAVNSEVNAIKNKLEPDKVTSSYSTSDFVQAVSMGDTNTASAAMDDIIATHVANGKTQAEAEAAFVSSVKTSTHDAYSSGLLDEAGAKNMLMEYADMDEEEAASRVNYWTFCEENPQYDYFSESNVNKYQEFAEPANISLEVYAQFVEGTKGLKNIKDEWGDVEKSVRDQKLEVIDSLPLTWEQKDALYLAAELAESKIWDVPW